MRTINVENPIVEAPVVFQSRLQMLNWRPKQPPQEPKKFYLPETENEGGGFVDECGIRFTAVQFADRRNHV